jgi:hypothetical protein
MSSAGSGLPKYSTFNKKTMENTRKYILLRYIIAAALLIDTIFWFSTDSKDLELPLPAVQLIQHLWDSGLLPAAKLVELLTIISFFSNKFVRLSSLMILPVLIATVIFNLVLDPWGLWLSMPVLSMTLYMISKNKSAFGPLIAKSW